VNVRERHGLIDLESNIRLSLGVIVRPQIVHVARPVLIDRPVPVTQRPIIIDRERPVPVPIRAAKQNAGQSAGAKVIRKEYVYRDNIPVAYAGPCTDNQHTASNAHQYGQSSAINGLMNGSGGTIEILDSTVNPSWQRTNQTALINRYGRSAANLVQTSNQVQQNVVQQFSQRSSNVTTMPRSASAGRFEYSAASNQFNY
jgi:hypothetical protein